MSFDCRCLLIKNARARAWQTQIVADIRPLVNQQMAIGFELILKVDFFWWTVLTQFFEKFINKFFGSINSINLFQSTSVCQHNCGSLLIRVPTHTHAFTQADFVMVTLSWSFVPQMATFTKSCECAYSTVLPLAALSTGSDGARRFQDALVVYLYVCMVCVYGVCSLVWVCVCV